MKSNQDETHIGTWHLSLGNHFVEVSIHNTERITTDDINKMIQETFQQLTLEEKTNFTFKLVNCIPYTKPDCDFNFNHNGREIEYILHRGHTDPFLNKLKSIDDAIISFDRVYKIISTHSNLIGTPFPETDFLRIRVNMKAYAIQRPPMSPSPTFPSPIFPK